MVIIMTDLNKKTGTVSVAVTSLLTVIFSCATVLLLGGGIELQDLESEDGVEPEEELAYDDERKKLSYRLGAFLDRRYAATHNEPPAHRMSTTLVRMHEALRHATSRIVRNLSFSLLMVCIGLCLLLAYMLLIYR